MSEMKRRKFITLLGSAAACGAGAAARPDGGFYHGVAPVARRHTLTVAGTCDGNLSLPSFHSIASPARASSIGGDLLFRLITRSSGDLCFNLFVH